MKIAFPCQEMNGLDSAVYGHFGSAGCFMLVNADDESCEEIDNRNRVHAHGQCQPLSALGGKQVDAVVVGGIGGGALMKLNAAGVKVYRAVEGSVRDNLDLLKTGKLAEYTMDQTCVGHGHGSGGPCAH